MEKIALELAIAYNEIDSENATVGVFDREDDCLIAEFPVVGPLSRERKDRINDLMVRLMAECLGVTFRTRRPQDVQ